MAHGGEGCAYAPVVLPPDRDSFVFLILRVVTGLRDSAFASDFESLFFLTRISFNDIPLPRDNRNGFEYYTTKQLHYTIRSGFFSTLAVMLGANLGLN